jgi:DNA-directed RNA polymerase specialized sigma24 family protein
MDEALRFCARVLIDPALAREAAEAAHAAAPDDRLALLAAAGVACRERVSQLPDPPRAAQLVAGVGGSELAAAVTREVAAACAQLAERHRETLALRELLALSYAEIAVVIRVEPAAVGSLLARARLRLRATLRGPFPSAEAPCEVADRSLRALARRQDGESLAAEQEDWLLEHLGSCEQCGRAHAAMLEASACYRGWDDPFAAADDGAELAAPA